MKIVSTQEELDQLREVPAGEEVEIRSGKTLSLNYDIEVRGFIRIEARLEYNASAELRGNARAMLRVPPGYRALRVRQAGRENQRRGKR